MTLSYLEQFKNFLRSATAHVLDGMEKVDNEKQLERLGICESNECGFFRDETIRCGKCGCFLAEKVSWRTSECPIGLWKQETKKTD